jgi:hypothetical protein
MKYTTFLAVVMLMPIFSFAQPSKNQTRSSKVDSTPKLTTYDLQLMNLNFTSMWYWYSTAMEIDSLYQMEKLKVHYYSKITGIQANSYETLQQIYDNKQAIEKAIGVEKEMQIKDLKKRNRRLIAQNISLSIGVAGLTFTTVYFALF